jgi:hypothetical protein
MSIALVALARGLSEVFPTPAGFFVVSCFVAPVLLEFVDPIISGGITISVFYTYVFAWPVVICGSVGALTLIFTFKNQTDSLKMLTSTERIIASWYFCCGFFFNSMMDVFAGQFQSWPIMSQRYLQLEPRYGMDSSYNGVTCLLTSYQELLVQAPLGLFLFYGYWTGKTWTKPIEIAFNMWSVAGVLYYYGSEVILGFPNVHYPRNFEEAISFEMVLKFWVGFIVFPSLFAVVGIVLTVRAVSYISMRLDERVKRE